MVGAGRRAACEGCADGLVPGFPASIGGCPDFACGRAEHMHEHMQLNGSITALATPFTASGAVDLQVWEALLERQLEAGTRAVVVAGSTGEAAMLRGDEFERLIASAVRRVEGRMRVLAGAGLSGTEASIEQAARAAGAGAEALLMVTPPYVRPTQEGLRRHFEQVADAARVPVLLYNVPPRTGVDLLPETVAALAPHPNICGLKEAVPGPARIEALLPLRGPGFVLLSGDDGSACQAQLAGVDGVISVASNLVPAAFQQLSRLARGGAQAAALALDAELALLYAALALEPNPIPLKAAMAELGLCQDALRLPLLPLSSPHRAAVIEAAARARRIEAAHRPPAA